MTDWVKVIIPVIVTFLLSGLSTAVYDLYAKIEKIADRQERSVRYVVKLDQIRKEVDDHENRLRIIIKNCVK